MLTNSMRDAVISAIRRIDRSPHQAKNWGMLATREVVAFIKARRPRGPQLRDRFDALADAVASGDAKRTKNALARMSDALGYPLEDES